METVTLAPLRAAMTSAAVTELTAGIPPEVFEANENAGAIVRAILVNNVPAGIVMVTIDRELMIAVGSTFRRHGVATQALELVKAAAKASGYSQLSAQAQVGAPSNGLLAKCGASESHRDPTTIYYVLTL